MTDMERQDLAIIGMEIIEGNITEEDIKELVVESYLSLREQLTASELEADLIGAITNLYTTLAVREATIGAMSEVIDELERELKLSCC